MVWLMLRSSRLQNLVALRIFCRLYPPRRKGELQLLHRARLLQKQVRSCYEDSFTANSIFVTVDTFTRFVYGTYIYIIFFLVFIKNPSGGDMWASIKSVLNTYYPTTEAEKILEVCC